jgi:large subunit ribosomal protein L25
MSEITSLQVDPREKTGKNANRRTRAEGSIPAVVYGAGKDSVPIRIDRKTLIDTMKAHAGENPIFLLKLGDKERHAMVRDVQLDPLTRQVIHVDFQRVLMDQKVRVQVPIELVGVAHGVKVEHGVLDFVTREVEIECLPGDIPKHLEYDVTELRVGEHVEAKDLPLPAGLTLLADPDKVVASLHHAKAEAVPEAEAAPAVPEPEVIKKAKPEAK